MSEIVLELQREAMNKEIDIETLLRKAYVIARKLKLLDFEEWVKCEQSGYGKKEVPEYRKVKGEIKAWNPMYGWIPVILQDSQVEETLTSRKLQNSISELADLYKNTEEALLIMNLPAECNRLLSKYCGFNTKYSLQFGKNQIYSILSEVRNRILEWSLILEDSGILGSNLMFTDEERKIAVERSEIANYIINVYGDATGLQVQQGNVDSEQKIQ